MSTAFVERFTSVAANGSAPPSDFFSPARADALRRFAEMGVPTQKNEDWHFTSLNQLSATPLAPVATRRASAPTVTPTELAALVLAGNSWPTAVLVNGRFSPELSSLHGEHGVTVTPLREALATGSPLAAANLGKIASSESHTFTALNTAFLADGVLVHVPRSVQAAHPLRIVHVADSSADSATVHPRVLIVAEENSRATVIEQFVSTADVPYFTNAVTEVRVDDGATLSHYKLQQEGRRAFHIGTAEVVQGRHSHYISFSFAVGARLSRTNIYTVMNGEGSGATLNGLYMVSGEQHVDHQTRIEHAQPNCFSREVYKGILDDSSHGVFNGKVYVRPEAQRTDGKQSNNNLLLSERAHIDTKPQLEIFADDVKCTHGATVGRLDAISLFYMKSRGMDDDQSRRLLTYAFAAEVLEQIAEDEVKLELESLTLHRFTL